MKIEITINGVAISKSGGPDRCCISVGGITEKPCGESWPKAGEDLQQFIARYRGLLNEAEKVAAELMAATDRPVDFERLVSGFGDSCDWTTNIELLQQQMAACRANESEAGSVCGSLGMKPAEHADELQCLWERLHTMQKCFDELADEVFKLFMARGDRGRAGHVLQCSNLRTMRKLLREVARRGMVEFTTSPLQSSH